MGRTLGMTNDISAAEHARVRQYAQSYLDANGRLPTINELAKLAVTSKWRADVVLQTFAKVVPRRRGRLPSPDRRRIRSCAETYLAQHGVLPSTRNLAELTGSTQSYAAVVLRAFPANTPRCKSTSGSSGSKSPTDRHLQILATVAKVGRIEAARIHGISRQRVHQIVRGK